MKMFEPSASPREIYKACYRCWRVVTQPYRHTPGIDVYYSGALRSYRLANPVVFRKAAKSWGDQQVARYKAIH